MLRNLSLQAAVGLVALVASHSAAVAESEHAGHFMECAKICADCQVECDACFKHCLSLTAGGKTQHARTAQFCLDCAECCHTCSAICARQSPMARTVLECCAKCCDECAGECEKLPDDKHMAACAKKCRDCAKECREMVKQLGA